MVWTHVRSQLDQMVGMQLSSISGQADITLIAIDDFNYIVERSDGTHITRSTSELHTVSDSMLVDVPVHVDTVLHGSGSSRNQPETILAALPEVTWLKILNRKHIVWRNTNSHALGTLQHD